MICFVKTHPNINFVWKHTVFPRIVSAETILFWKWKMWKFSFSFCIIAILYFINWIVAAETIQGGKLFKGGVYSRKYGSWIQTHTIKGKHLYGQSSSKLHQTPSFATLFSIDYYSIRLNWAFFLPIYVV